MHSRVCVRAYVHACVCVCARACMRGAILTTTECFNIGLLEPQYKKTGFWHMRKQRRRSCTHEADQRLCFHYTDSTISLLRSWSAPLFSLLRKYNPSTFYTRNFKPLAIFCSCTAWFVSDLVGNPKDWFSHNEIH